MFLERPKINNDFMSVIYDFHVENLIVSGGSFTYNNSEEHACTWPYYLKPFGNFKRVLDCSLPGAGNFHIAHSLQWNLQCWPVDPKKSLVIVMWSSNLHDDTICAEKYLNQYPFRHYYTESVCTALTGGLGPESKGNITNLFKQISDIKDKNSRAVENFLYITGLWAWLQHKGYKAIFLNYMDNKISFENLDIDIAKFLPKHARAELDNIMIDHHNLYNFAIKKDLLTDDEFHPSPDGHLLWTKEVLLPTLKKIVT